MQPSYKEDTPPPVQNREKNKHKKEPTPKSTSATPNILNGMSARKRNISHMRFSPGRGKKSPQNKKHKREPLKANPQSFFLIWSKDIELTVNSSSPNHIDTTIISKGIPFRATFVYGEPDHSKRQAIWQMLTNLQPANGEPWFLSGDFNEIIDNSEKKGCVVRAEGIFCAFRAFLAQNDLFDIKHHGNFLS
ncbi:hypothetical protein F2Q68_00012364 [Brassica cretica]|uniref:Endonuclease/exonuclease/phosphatase domain-containing protein n=1 Tax=Brassica cretica TaxID=69181 RepID=A0A8S9KRC4_BRACR|nr:hypothetical protein F2Q68_00012364 [Brassica cretica]